MNVVSDPKIPVRKDLLHLRPSHTLAINELSQKLINEGKEIYKFGFGQSPFPVPKVVKDALIVNAFQKDYLPVQGLWALREAIANHTNSLIPGSSFTHNNVVIGPGSKELIFILQLIIDAPLILPSPSWVSYQPQANIINKNVYWINSIQDEWKLNAKDLSSFFEKNDLSSGLLIINYPSNPTGQELNADELKSLAEVCRAKKIIVISDEIYGALSFDYEYKSISAYYPEGTIITSGLSKWCGAGGWRLGYAIMPEQLREVVRTIISIASETYSSVCAPVQYAATVAYSHQEELFFYKKSTTSILQLLADYCFKKLVDNQVKAVRCKGGFYLFPDFEYYRDVLCNKGIVTSNKMCSRLLMDTGVALLPGSVFGRPEHEFSARLSFVDFDGAEILNIWENNADEIRQDVARYFPKIAQGLSRMIDWFKSQ